MSPSADCMLPEAMKASLPAFRRVRENYVHSTKKSFGVAVYDHAVNECAVALLENAKVYKSEILLKMLRVANFFSKRIIMHYAARRCCIESRCCIKG